MFVGQEVVWDIAGVWWFRDAQEKAYLGLWRQPRPPTTAKLELRNLFGDLLNRHSPYDGQPVRDGADSLTVSIAIQAPGTALNTVSADVAYAMTLCLDGHPSLQQMSLQQAETLKAIRILEHGIGQDVPVETLPTVSSYLTTQLQLAQDRAQSVDGQFGRDIRGRLFSQDIDDYLFASLRKMLQTPIGAVGGASIAKGAGAEDLTPQNVETQLMARSQALETYWRIAPAVVHNRDLWNAFLLHNSLPQGTPHETAVLDAESRLKAVMSQAYPSVDWARNAAVLNQAYVDERRRIARGMKSIDSAVFHPRQSACPEPAIKTSGKDTPAIGAVERSLEEYYPKGMKREAVEGLTVLEVRVNAGGCVTAAAVTGSSGSDDLDDAALRWVETASYVPAERDGKPVDSTSNVAVDFRLGN
jgi:protein TonB